MCKHEWVLISRLLGVAKGNDNTANLAFYCKFCIEIKLESVSLLNWDWTDDEY